MNILVSIVVPVYNVESLVSKCIKSICAQTYQHIEIIIVNDGSTDDSLTVINKYASSDSRIIILDQVNGGLSAARNSAIAMAKGEFIIFVVSDDIIEDKLVEECLSISQRDKSDIVVYGYKKVTEDMTLIAQPDYGNRVLLRNEALDEILSLSISPMACNKFIKTDLFHCNNILFPLSKLHEDIGTTYKLFTYADKISTTSKSYYFWVNRSDSITGSITFKHIHHLNELLLEQREFLKDNNIDIRYNNAHKQGCLKMLTLILERSLNTSKSLVDYTLYIIDNGILLSEQDISVLRNTKKHTVAKFDKLYHEANLFVDNRDISMEEFYALQKQRRDLAKELDKIHRSKVYRLLEKYKSIRDLILPIGSNRRNMIKKYFKN